MGWLGLTGWGAGCFRADLVRLARGVGFPILSAFVSCVAVGIGSVPVAAARIPAEQGLSGYAVIGNARQGSPGIGLDRPLTAVNDWRNSQQEIDMLGPLGARMERRLCFRVRSKAVRCAVETDTSHRTAVVMWTWGLYHQRHLDVPIEPRMATAFEEFLLRLAAYSVALVDC